MQSFLRGRSCIDSRSVSTFKAYSVSLLSRHTFDFSKVRQEDTLKVFIIKTPPKFFLINSPIGPLAILDS